MNERYLDLRESTVALIKHFDINAGYWNLGVRFALGVGSFPNTEYDGGMPTGFAQVVEIGIQETDPSAVNAMTVDASDVTRRMQPANKSASPETE